MKKQILTLIIGILIGAIIATAVFMVLKNDQEDNMRRGDMGEPPQMDGNMVMDENFRNGGNRPQRGDMDGNTVEDSQAGTTEESNT